MTRLVDLAGISIAFAVRSVLEVEPDLRGGFRLSEREVEAPYEKDYDAIGGNRPEDWLARFDTREWGLLLVEEKAEVIGACLLAWNTPGVEMLEGRSDLAVLWDLRVDPVWRGKGVGSALFQAARAWAFERGAAELKVETQNNNVSAVRFYLRMGCTLRSVVHGAYADFPEESMLLFYVPASG